MSECASVLLSEDSRLPTTRNNIKAEASDGWMNESIDILPSKWQHFTRNIQNVADLFWQMLSEAYVVCSLKLFEGHGHKEQLDTLLHLNHTGCDIQPDWCSLTITLSKDTVATTSVYHIYIYITYWHTVFKHVKTDLSLLTVLWLHPLYEFLVPWKNKNNYCNELLSCCQVLQASIWHDCFAWLNANLRI